ncbi:Uncharacterised protein [Mycobacterium tuberculosis]|nr:Uncharacterised protein [Mycobacterium tuberculosis]COW85804.1 Uncharacterised protein [Mycobacterium tuberculosis]
MYSLAAQRVQCQSQPADQAAGRSAGSAAQPHAATPGLSSSTPGAPMPTAGDRSLFSPTSARTDPRFRTPRPGSRIRPDLQRGCRCRGLRPSPPSTLRRPLQPTLADTPRSEPAPTAPRYSRCGHPGWLRCHERSPAHDHRRAPHPVAASAAGPRTPHRTRSHQLLRRRHGNAR